jgi:phosphohistidine phosphatase SixA
MVQRRRHGADIRTWCESRGNVRGAVREDVDMRWRWSAGTVVLPVAALGVALVVAVAVTAARPAAASEAKAWAALADGGIVLLRHALAPGTGDPSGFRVGDCATQRNLNETGRTQARRIGAAFRARAVPVGAVLSSLWCRCLETAELAFPGRVAAEPAFNSFFEAAGRGPAQTAAALARLLAWNGPGALVVVTHQVNITGLTGLVPSSGEGVVLVRRGDALAVVGRIMP